MQDNTTGRNRQHKVLVPKGRGMAFLKKVLRPGQKPGEAPASITPTPLPVPTLRPANTATYEDEPLSLLPKECVEHIKAQKIAARDAIDEFDILLMILAADFKGRPELYKPIKALARERARTKRNSGIIGSAIVGNPEPQPDSPKRRLTRTISSDAIRQASDKLAYRYPLDDDSDEDVVPAAPKPLTRKETRAKEIEKMKEEWRRKMRGEPTEEDKMKEEWRKKMRGETTEEEKLKEEWKKKMRGDEAANGAAPVAANAASAMTEAERMKEEWRKKMRGETPTEPTAAPAHVASVAGMQPAAPHRKDSTSTLAANAQRKLSAELGSASVSAPTVAPALIVTASADTTLPTTPMSATTPQGSPRPPAGSLPHRTPAAVPPDEAPSEQSSGSKEKKDKERRKNEKKERKRAQKEADAAVTAAAAVAPAVAPTPVAAAADTVSTPALRASTGSDAVAPAPATSGNSAAAAVHVAAVARSGSPFSKRDTIRSTKPIVEQLVDLCKRDDPNKYYGDRCRIGKGGFGEVFLATDLRFKKGAKQAQVAIKISKEKYNSGFQGELIANEILLLASCRHKNIVNYLEAYIFKERVWTVMEYCDGGTLTELYKGVELGEPHFSFIIKEILVGLAYLHSLNRLHRDIKGENILLNMDGDIKIADLGLAAEADEKGVGLVGSRYWMSPEMIRREGYDYKTDIWSTGCVLIEMCNCEPPYHEYRSTKALFKIATKGAAPLKHPEAFSIDLKSFLAIATRSKPEERPDTAELMKHPWIVKSGTKDDMMKATEVVFLGNSLRMNGF